MMQRLDATLVRESARGAWRPMIYPSLGIEVGSGKHQYCPHCGGKDRFRCDDRDGSGSYFCNGCGAGDGFSLIMKMRACRFPDALHLVAGILGLSSSPSVSFRPNAFAPRPAVDRRRLARDFELHALALKERAEATLCVATGLHISAWSDADLEMAQQTVANAHHDIRHAEMLFGVVDGLRARAYQEDCR